MQGNIFVTLTERKWKLVSIQYKLHYQSLIWA